MDYYERISQIAQDENTQHKNNAYPAETRYLHAFCMLLPLQTAFCDGFFLSARPFSPCHYRDGFKVFNACYCSGVKTHISDQNVFISGTQDPFPLQRKHWLDIPMIFILVYKFNVKSSDFWNYLSKMSMYPDRFLLILPHKEAVRLRFCFKNAFTEVSLFNWNILS